MDGRAAVDSAMTVWRWPRQPADYADPKASLLSSLRDARAAVLSTLDGLSEYDIRRPLTPTGTNLLGLVKHLTMSEARYLGDVFGRPFAEHLPYWDEAAELDAGMWAAEHETRCEVVDRYQRACAHADATIAALRLDAPGVVPWWTASADVVLFNVLVHVVVETSRHAGHADIVREQIDGAAGGRLPNAEEAEQRSRHREQIEQAARSARS
jgi:hypothetical protein